MDRLSAALADRYRIERELGEGGMATVYLAHDLRHDRQVALKVLRPELAAILGADRFLKEIKTTANLQHPHILSLFDSGEADGLVYYVMPYVEGESLRDRISREHQLPLDDALRITREVADALAYAHGHGIVHRDIKPENILLHGGHAQVADFGIALAASRSEGGTRLTETGMSLGTPFYMAPEQAMGEREITPKADIYALGCVLYEMLVGEPPFTGATAQAIIARVMTEEPRSLTLQRRTIPAHIEAAVGRALEKLPADRFGSAAEFAAALENTGFTSSRPAAAGVAPSSGWRARVAVPALAVAGAAVLVAAWLAWRPAVPAPVIRYGLALPPSQAPFPARAVPSPDGSNLLYVGPVSGQLGQVSQGIYQLWLKSRDRADATPVPGTMQVFNATFSPDGKWIAYVQASHLMKIAVTGGSPVTLADSVAFAQPGLAWLDDGTIVYTQLGALALRRVPAVGGTPTVVYRSTFNLREPSPLPGARGVLFAHCTDRSCTARNVEALDLRSGATHLVVNGADMGRYLRTGHVLYVRDDGAAFVVPFDPSSFKVKGAPVSVEDSVSLAPGFPLLSVSDGGTMVVHRGAGSGVSGQYELVWIDRAGVIAPIDMGGPLKIDPGGGNPGWALSPDGRRLAIGLLTSGGGDIWVKQLPNGPLSRVTFDSLPDMRPRWEPGGRRITYVAEGSNFDLHQVNADGTGGDTVLARHPDAIFEGAVSPDGQWIVARIRGGLGHQGRDIIGYRRGDTTAVPLIASADFDENAFRLSPDGRWIAYESDESGRREVYVRPFPNTNSGKWQASIAGGYAPLWAPSGRELFFVDVQRRMTVVPFTPGVEPRLGDRKVLFTLPQTVYLWENDYYTPFDISPDGRRFLMARQVQNGDSGEEPLIVTENWFTELRQRLRGH
ncbi:MAG TPA: protein kinase [Gemmatimonadales bacterium]|nr:protein kinase [Gemmatimonadales bacterium]